MREEKDSQCRELLLVSGSNCRTGSMESSSPQIGRLMICTSFLVSRVLSIETVVDVLGRRNHLPLLPDARARSAPTHQLAPLSLAVLWRLTSQAQVHVTVDCIHRKRLFANGTKDGSFYYRTSRQFRPKHGSVMETHNLAPPYQVACSCETEPQ